MPFPMCFKKIICNTKVILVPYIVLSRYIWTQGCVTHSLALDCQIFQKHLEFMLLKLYAAIKGKDIPKFRRIFLVQNYVLSEKGMNIN